MGERHPVALAPTRWLAGTRTPSNATIGWWWPIVCEYAGVRTTRTPGRRQVDEEHRVLAVVVAAHQPRLEEGVRRLVVRRDVPLLAVQDVVVAVPPRGGRQVGDVGPGVLLGDGVALRPPRRAPWAAASARAGTASPPPAATTRGSGHAPGERVRDPAALLLDEHLLQGACSPRPPSAAGMFVAVRPSSQRPGRGGPRRPRRASRPSCSSASTSYGISSSANARAAACSSRSDSVRRYMVSSRRQSLD